MALVFAGRAHESERSFQIAIPLLREAGDLINLELALANMAGLLPKAWGIIALREGDLVEARRHLERAAELSTGVNSEVVENARAYLAELAILQGAAAEARDIAQEVLTVESTEAPRFLALIAWADLELGEAGRALELVERAEARLRGGETLLHPEEALHIRGMALTRLGRHGEARAALRAALERARSLPNLYAEARVLEALGQLARREGDAAEANVRLAEALAIFISLGAGRDVERLQGEPSE